MGEAGTDTDRVASDSIAHDIRSLALNSLSAKGKDSVALGRGVRPFPALLVRDGVAALGEATPAEMPVNPDDASEEDGADFGRTPLPLDLSALFGNFPGRLPISTNDLAELYR